MFHDIIVFAYIIVFLTWLFFFVFYAIVQIAIIAWMGLSLVKQKLREISSN